MKRLNCKTGYLFLAMMIAAGIFVMFGNTPAAAETIEIKLAHFMPTMHVQHRMAFEPFAKKIDELTDGKVKIKIYPGGTLGNPKTMVDSIRKGITVIGFVLPSYVPGRFKRSSVFELPFVCNSASHVAKVFYANYDEYFAEDYKDFKVLWFLSSPLSQCQTLKKPILSAADFKGMKIRTGGSKETEGIKLLGGNPIGMPISELSISLQKGVVDGAFTPYAALNSHKLIDVVKHITEVNYSGALMGVLMNKKKWNSLPDYARKAIDQVATQEFGLMAAAAFDEEDAENIKLGQKKGIQFHKLSDAEMRKIRNRVDPIYSNWIKKNASAFPSQKIFDAVTTSAKKIK